jgi:hypothetical protein
VTVAINGKPDVLTIPEVWALCRAHIELGLQSDQVGMLAVGDTPDPDLLETEVRDIMASRPELKDACSRILDALGKT